MTDRPGVHLAIPVRDLDDALADRLRRAGTDFLIEPYLRFPGEPAEQWTMFFRDPSGNALEFKAFRDEGNVFAA